MKTLFSKFDFDQSILAWRRSSLLCPTHMPVFKVSGQVIIF